MTRAIPLSVLAFLLAFTACGDPAASDEGSSSQSESGASEESESETETETGADACLDVVNLPPNFEITGMAPSGSLNWGGPCILSSAEFIEAEGVFEILFGCTEGGQSFNLGISISELEAAPSGFMAGTELDVFVQRETVVPVETDPEQWFEIKSGPLTLAAGHVRAHGSRNVGPLSVEAFTDCEIVEGEPPPQGYLVASTGEDEVRIEVGEVASLAVDPYAWNIHAREAIPSCCLGYESTVTIVRQ